MSSSLARRSTLLLPLAVLLALATLLLAAASATAAERWTPVTAGVVAAPQPVLASDDRQHLAYELLLINRSFNPPAPVTLRSVQALAGGKVVATLKGRALAAVTFPFGDDKPGTKLDKGEAGFVMMDVSLPRGAKLPRRLTHRISISVAPPNATVAKSYAAAPTRVERRPAMVVAPPLRGSGWIVGNGCCADLTSHRAGLLPVNGAMHQGERFAIDFIQLTPAGMLGSGPLTQLSSYPFFGADVISAAPGRVVAVVDGIPETPPGQLPPSTAARAGGNHVVVDVGGGRFAFYAHLQPGSIAVRVGERVGVGQLIGLLGSSGNSNAPHLHFQLMDGPNPLADNGVPYRFDRFDVAGELTNFGGIFNGEAAEIAPRLRGPHRDELPLTWQVVDFAG